MPIGTCLPPLGIQIIEVVEVVKPEFFLAWRIPVAHSPDSGFMVQKRKSLRANQRLKAMARLNRIGNHIAPSWRRLSFRPWLVKPKPQTAI
jgi:hypothetical protein